MSGKAAKVVITERQQSVLREIADARSSEIRYVQRARIVLLAFEKVSNEEISPLVGLNRDQVGLWRRRWQAAFPKLVTVECNESRDGLRKAILGVLSDEHRSGRPPQISTEQQAKLTSIACERPEDEQRPLSHWSSSELAALVKERGIIDAISDRHVRTLLKRTAIRPHCSKYWLTSPDRHDADYDSRVAEICRIYAAAIDNYQKNNIHTVCIDEQTGIQALERISADYLPRPGHVAKREFEYRRHGTASLFGNFEVATGRILAPLIGETRTEEDFLENINNLLCLDPDGEWQLIVDNLNTHCSESCVRFVAACCGITDDLGKKGVRGILKSRHSRTEFLSDRSHRIRFIYLPRHASWLNQIEIWFGVLRRKVTRWGNFTSLADLRDKITRFIEYYNTTLAHPYNWTYTGRLLCI